jgi:hypothetical protein
LIDQLHRIEPRGDQQENISSVSTGADGP